MRAREPDCVFCQKIDPIKPLSGVTHFEPLNPYVPGHRLFIPNRHLPSAASDRTATGMVIAEAVWFAAEHGIKSYNLLTSVGRGATQTVFHLHVHLLPRGPEDGIGKDWPWNRPEKYLPEEEQCGKPVGRKPYWMGDDQWSQCRCVLLPGHDGDCECEHG